NMDLFVFPSQTETVGNVVLEALASGVPVVAMAQGGPNFLGTSRASAELVPDHASLVTLVKSLVRAEPVRRQMRTAARAWSMKRSWDAIFEVVYQAYGEAVTSLSSPRLTPVAEISQHRVG